MNVNLKCKKRNLDGSYKDFTEWDISSIDSKILNQEYSEILSEAYNYRETRITRPETMLYICSCNTYINIEMKIVLKNNTYSFSDFDAGQHNRECPFFSFKQHRNEEGRIIALSPSMFNPALEKEKINHIDIRNGNVDTTIARVNTKQTTTFDGLMYSLFDSMNISMNRNGNYKKSNVCQQFIGRFLNTAVGVNNAVTFATYRNNLKEDQYISFDVGFIDDAKVILREIKWNKKSKKSILLQSNDEYINHKIDAAFVDNIKDKKFSLGNQFTIYKDRTLSIMKKVPIVPNLVMKQTLQGIRNYNNFTEGPYFFVKVDTRQVKKEKYSTVVQFFLQPIYMSEKYILPVESHFERECIQYLDEAHDDIRLYKPLTLDKELFLKNLQYFLNSYPAYFNIYKQACYQYNQNKVIRPDLFMLKEDKLYVFEFAGYIDKEEYLDRLQTKKEEFYMHFDNILEIKYVEIRIDSMIQNFHDSGL